MHTHHPRPGTAGRFTVGLISALALTLVAFEWRSAGPGPMVTTPLLPVEDPWEYPPVIIIEQQAARKAAKPKVARSTLAEITAGPEHEPEHDPKGEEGTGTALEADTMARETDGPEGGDAPVIEVFPWTGVEVRPYFLDCLKRSPGDLWGCTEHRIDQHLRRHFRMPRGLRGEVRTVVTFEIDDAGQIGRLVCTPRVGAEVEQEIERVLRAMPRFVPGSQNGVPVPVFHRIPITLRSY